MIVFTVSGCVHECTCECVCVLGFDKTHLISTHSIFTGPPLLFPGDSFLIKSVAASESQFKHVECIYSFMTAEMSLIMNVSTFMI